MQPSDTCCCSSCGVMSVIPPLRQDHDRDTRSQRLVHNRLDTLVSKVEESNKSQYYYDSVHDLLSVYVVVDTTVCAITVPNTHNI